MRGTVSAGMALALHELGLTPAFDAVYGASAGAITGAWLLSSAPERLRGWADPDYAKTLIRWSALLRGRPVVDVKTLIEVVYQTGFPMDFESVLASEIEYHPLGTDAETGESTDLRPLIATAAELRLALRASASLPFLAGPAVELRGRRFFDAGVAESIPYRTPHAQGATHILLLRSRRPLSLDRAGTLTAAGPVANGRDTAGRDTAGQDTASRDGAVRDGAGRDTAGRDTAGQDTASRDGAVRDGAGRDTAGRDTVGRERAVRDGAGQDGAVRDGAGRDTAGRDTAGRDTVGRERAVRDGAGQDRAVRDSAGRDSAVRERAGRERALQDSGDQHNLGSNTGPDSRTKPEGNASPGGHRGPGVMVPRPPRSIRLLTRTTLRKESLALRTALLTRPVRTAADVARIALHEAEGTAFTVYPPRSVPPVSRLTTDSRLLAAALEAGRAAVWTELGKLVED
jgi:predicted acylesterase/phospholipase RssA